LTSSRANLKKKDEKSLANLIKKVSSNVQNKKDPALENFEQMKISLR
jgi:hypothetical protein